MAKRNAGKRFNSLSSIGVFTFVFGAMLNTSVYSQSVTYDCGTIKFPAGLTVERNQTHAGFWPFAVGIVEIEDNRLFCAGTLISRKHVLTGEYEECSNCLSLYDDLHKIFQLHIVSKR